MIDRLGVVGLGLIGASFALAAKQRGVAGAVTGFDVDRSAALTALEMGVVTHVADSVENLASQVDLVVIATPVGAVRAVLTSAAAASAWFMDVGSTKQSVIVDAKAALGERSNRFIPAHPIAGGEKSGPTHARTDLFVGRNAILTPTPHNSPALIALARSIWERLGAAVIEMSAERHDMIFSAVSHVPHLASFALVAEYAGRAEAPYLFKHAGGGFRDFARIAGSSPAMWRDIAIANRDAVVADLDRYMAAVAAMRTAIANADGEALSTTMSRARDMRARWLAGEFEPLIEPPHDA